MSEMTIDKRIDSLPEGGITVMALKALDFIVPGQWVNDTDFDAMIRRVTGVEDGETVARIHTRAVQLYKSSDEGYTKAMTVFGAVDTVDKVIAATAMASKLGQSVSFLGFLNRLTPKADTTQAIDAGLKLVAEVSAFLMMRGIPRENIGDFVKGLADYGKADIMRLSSWIVIDGLIPLGPDFMAKIISGVEGMESSTLFKKMSGHLPGNTTSEKKNFVAKALSSSSSWVNNFVAEKGLTQDLVVSKIKGLVGVADSGLDVMAAALDASTDYFSHTGAQTVAREVILRAYGDISGDISGDSGGAASAVAAATAAAAAASVSSGGSSKGRTGAFMHAICLAATADGNLSEVEKKSLVENVMSMPGAKGKPKAKIEKRLKRCLKNIKKNGFDEVMAQVVDALTNDEDRLKAFAMAASVQFSDGELSPEEDDFIFQFGTQLGLSSQDTQSVLADLQGNLEEEEDDWGDDW